MDACGPRLLRNWTFGFSLREAVCHPATTLEAVGCCVADEGVWLSMVLIFYSALFVFVLSFCDIVQTAVFIFIFSFFCNSKIQWQRRKEEGEMLLEWVQGQEPEKAVAAVLAECTVRHWTTVCMTNPITELTNSNPTNTVRFHCLGSSHRAQTFQLRGNKELFFCSVGVVVEPRPYPLLGFMRTIFFSFSFF